MNQGKILILSGPSGSGKSTLCNALKEEFSNLYFSISTTTRAPRKNELDGREYFFTDKETFIQHIKENKFLEWAEVHQNFYGTAIAPIQEALKKNQLVVFDVDVQGFFNIKKHYPHISTSVFITTPNDLILKERLQNRKTDSQEVIQRRLEHAYKEMLCAKEFDFLIVNDNLQNSTKQILSIANILACKNFDIQDFCKQWKTI